MDFTSDGVPCCDYPDLVTTCFPVVACRACGSIWDEFHSSQAESQRCQSEVPAVAAPQAA
jgi:hypothetical protein